MALPGNTNKQKGNRAERAVANVFNAIFTPFHALKARRVLTETREASFDVEIIKEVRGKFGDRDSLEERRLPYAVQVKNHKNHPSSTLLLAYREAANNPGFVPVGVAYVPKPEGRGREWVACISLGTLAELIRRTEGAD